MDEKKLRRQNSLRQGGILDETQEQRRQWLKPVKPDKRWILVVNVLALLP